MEKVIYQYILEYLEKHNLINDRQYGFRQKRSTVDLLSYVTHLWRKSIDLHGELIVVAFDISTAFDKVWHTALLYKLPPYGVPIRLCS